MRRYALRDDRGCSEFCDWLELASMVNPGASEGQRLLAAVRQGVVAVLPTTHSRRI
jgi:hypothetical protein